MQFTTDGLIASKALAKLLRVAGKDVEELTLRANGNATLEIHALSLQRRSMIRVPASVQTPGQVNIERLKFAGICKGRGKLDFTINKMGLNFQSSTGYRGRDIAILPYKDLQLLKINNRHNIPEHIQVKLLAAIKACLINSVFGGQQLGLILQLTRRYFQVIVADAYHAAIAKFDLTKAEYRKLKRAGLQQDIILPVAYAEMLTKQFARDGLLLQVNNKTVVFANNEIQVELPALQSNHTLLQHALKLDAGFDRNFVLLPQAQRLISILGNIKVIGKSNEPMILRLRQREKILYILYRATSGKINDQLELDTTSIDTVDLYLEPNNYYDIAGKLTGDTRIAYNRHIVRFSCQYEGIEVNYYSSQVQRTKS